MVAPTRGRKPTTACLGPPPPSSASWALCTRAPSPRLACKRPLPTSSHVHTSASKTAGTKPVPVGRDRPQARRALPWGGHARARRVSRRDSGGHTPTCTKCADFLSRLITDFCSWSKPKNVRTDIFLHFLKIQVGNWNRPYCFELSVRSEAQSPSVEKIFERHGRYIILSQKDFSWYLKLFSVFHPFFPWPPQSPCCDHMPKIHTLHAFPLPSIRANATLPQLTELLPRQSSSWSME